jgi:hypothetical protein
MARITCIYSGVVFNCEHMPMGLSSHEYHHPLFSVPKKRLLALTKDWSANKLSATESYLLYLSLLHSTDLIIWRTQARYTEKTQSVIHNNMEHLVQIIGKIDIIHHPHFVLPKFAITHDTGDLANSFYWIQAWHANYKEFMEDFLDSQKREELKVKVERRENTLERLIKNPQADLQTVANNLAEWAALAGNFPDYEVFDSRGKNKVPIAEYWKDIISACAKSESIWHYKRADLEELIEHCEENIPHGTIHAHSLMKILRMGLVKHKDYTMFGDVDLAGKTTSFKLLDPNASAEEANLTAAIQAAPDAEPIKANYPKLGDFIRAKLNWDLKQRMGG